MTGRMRNSCSFACALLLFAAHAMPAAAQRTVEERLDSASAAPQQALSVSPRGALLRSILIPGWGQAAAHSYVRGGVFFAVRAASGYMLLKTLGRLAEARDVEARRVDFATDSLNMLIAVDTTAARQQEDPEAYAHARLLADSVAAFQEAVDANERVIGARSLVDAREQQRQDWITYALVFTMLDGVDAYVNRQLKDFPAELDSRALPGGGISIGLRVPVGRIR